MRLYGIELRRFLSRRANIVLAGVGIAFLVAVLAVLVASTHTPSDTELADAHAQAELARDQIAEDRALCQLYHDDPAAFQAEVSRMSDAERAERYYIEYPEEFPQDCEGEFDPSQINVSDYMQGVLVFEDEAEDQIIFLGVIFALCGLLMASSFVGAEWTSGGMTNLLLWQPRRQPVFFSKFGAALTCVLGVAMLYSVVHMGALLLISAVRGEVGTLDGAWWGDQTEMVLRLLAIVVVAVAFGMGLAMIGRRTVAAIGAVIAYAALFEFGARLLLDSVDVAIDIALLSTYMVAWMNDGIYVTSNGLSSYAYEDYGYYSDYVGFNLYISDWAGGAVLLAVTAALVAGASTLFAKRDAV
ncbi:MAG: ABC transporter permease subunit [Stackebrandtia sp.]